MDSPTVVPGLTTPQLTSGEFTGSSTKDLREESLAETKESAISPLDVALNLNMQLQELNQLVEKQDKEIQVRLDGLKGKIKAISDRK